MGEKTQKYLAVVRIALGLIFLWAFFDKLFGLGFATKAGSSVLDGVSATAGFLGRATSGPFASFYQSLATSNFVEWLFLIGLLLIGIAFVFGIGMRLAVWGGSILMLLMWSSALPPENNPIIDDHIIYFLVILALGQARAGDVFGLGNWWKNTALVRSVKLFE